MDYTKLDVEAGANPGARRCCDVTSACARRVLVARGRLGVLDVAARRGAPRCATPPPAAAPSAAPVGAARRSSPRTPSAARAASRRRAPRAFDEKSTSGGGPARSTCRGAITARPVREVAAGTTSACAKHGARLGGAGYALGHDDPARRSNDDCRPRLADCADAVHVRRFDFGGEGFILNGRAVRRPSSGGWQRACRSRQRAFGYGGDEAASRAVAARRRRASNGEKVTRRLAGKRGPPGAASAACGAAPSSAAAVGAVGGVHDAAARAAGGAITAARQHESTASGGRGIGGGGRRPR